MRNREISKDVVRRLSIAAITFLIAVSVPSQARASSFRSLSANEAARMVKRENGHVTVVFLYAAYCPHCRSMFPDFVRLAERYGKHGVSVLAFATDEDSAATDAYVGAQRLPFARLHIEPWAKGELTQAFASTGVKIADQFGVPLLAIVDRNGESAGQWSGAGGLAGVQSWLQAHVES